jgi:hypothetical protein
MLPRMEMRKWMHCLCKAATSMSSLRRFGLAFSIFPVLGRCANDKVILQLRSLYYDNDDACMPFEPGNVEQIFKDCRLSLQRGVGELGN